MIVAEENDNIPSMKVGRIGDVIRDMPKAPVATGYQVGIILLVYAQLEKSC
ncbi:MAG: glycogen/starch synthase [Colwellia sp.]